MSCPSFTPGSYDHSIFAVLVPVSKYAILCCMSCSSSDSVEVLKNNLWSTQRSSIESSPLALKTSREHEKITIGIGTDNSIVLNSEGDFPSHTWINACHAELYPDPDNSSLILRNMSGSNFLVTSRSSLQQQICRTGRKPSEPSVCLLEPGVWDLRLASEIEFRIEVTRRPNSQADLVRHGILISPVTTPKQKRTEKGQAKQKRRVACSSQRSLRRPKACIRLSFSAEVVQEKPQLKDCQELPTGTKLITSEQPPVTITDEPASASESAILEPMGESIFRNLRTEVFKVERQGVLSAVKVCRKFDLLNSAKSWKREKDMLSGLKHVCALLLTIVSSRFHLTLLCKSRIVNLISYDAGSLSLSTKFVGPHLGTFCDEFNHCTLQKLAKRTIWNDVASGLAFLESKKVIHNDIKPSNIVVSSSNRATLCDFEMAEFQGSTNISNGGTPLYVPPEYLMYRKRDMQGDIWAAGIVVGWMYDFIEIADQERWIIREVHSNTSESEKMLRWLQKVQDMKKRIPKELNLLTKMLEVERSQRITAGTFADALSVAGRKRVPKAKIPMAVGGL